MNRVIANRSDRPSSRRFTWILEIVIVLSVAPVLALGVWSFDALPIA